MGWHPNQSMPSLMYSGIDSSFIVFLGWISRWMDYILITIKVKVMYGG